MAKRFTEFLRPTPECRPIDDLVTLLAGRCGNELKESCERHITNCASCSAEVALFRSFDSPSLAAEERDAVSAIVSQLRRKPLAASGARWKQIWRPRILVPLAAGLAAALITVMVNVESRRSPIETSVQDVTRSAQIAAIAPIGEISDRPQQIRWHQVNGASSYRVRLLEVDKTELWNATTSSASIEIPSEVRERITPLKKMLWEVTALDSSGNPLGSSGLQSFRLH